MPLLPSKPRHGMAWQGTGRYGGRQKKSKRAEEQSKMSDQPPMLPNERADAYMRRTGYHPPHWTSDQSRAFDGKVHDRKMAGDRRWLARYGLLDD